MAESHLQVGTNNRVIITVPAHADIEEIVGKRRQDHSLQRAIKNSNEERLGLV